MSQPTWKFFSNLGDASPIEYGGLFVYVDQTGVYPPEATKLVSPDSDNGEWTEYRFILEPLTADSIKTEWFYDDLDSVASFIGSTTDELISDLIGDDLSDKARAWESIGEYHGFENLDSYPLTYKGIKGKAELEQRFWHESGESHPPAGAKYKLCKMSYSISADEASKYSHLPQNSAGLQSMTFGTYGKEWSSLISLGQLF